MFWSFLHHATCIYTEGTAQPYRKLHSLALAVLSQPPALQPATAKLDAGSWVHGKTEDQLMLPLLCTELRCSPRNKSIYT